MKPKKTKGDFLAAVLGNDLHLSYSSILALLKSPKHFFQYHTEKKDPTPSMILGSLVHCFILTPDLLEAQFAVKPQNANKASNANKAILAEFEAQAGEKIQVSENDYLIAKMAAQAIFNDKILTALLEGEKEKPFEFIYRDVKIKGVYDIYNLFTGATDLKFTADAMGSKFARKAIYDFKYHLQAAIYTHEDRSPYTIVCVDNDFHTNCFIFDEDIMKAGSLLFDKAILIYKKLQAETVSNPDIWQSSYSYYSPNGYKIS